jgi:hypothetical protein
MGEQEAEKDRQQVQIEEQHRQPSAVHNLKLCAATGSRLKTASAPLATQIAMVSM